MKKWKKHILPISTIAVAVLLFHLYFLRDDIPFMFTKGDPIDQYLKFQWLLLENFKAGNFEWSWFHGLGGDLIGEYMYYYATSIFYLVNLFLPISTLAELVEAKLWISIVKVTLAGVFFYFYMVYLKKSKSASLFGVFLYIGSIKLMQTSFYSDFMADAFVFLPLVIWALDVYIEKGKPLFFIVTVFLMIQSNFYFAYNTTVYLMIYTVVVLLFKPEVHNVKLFSKKLLSVAWAYLLALLLASYSFLPAVYQFLDAYRFSKEYLIPLTYPAAFYTNVPIGLFFNITTITIPAFFFILLIAGIRVGKKEYAVPLIMATLMFIFYQIPFMYSLFNGFSAMQSRWVYLMLFAFAVIVTFTMDEWLKGENMKGILFVIYYALVGYALNREETLNTFLSSKWTLCILLLHIILPLFLLIRQNYRRYAVIAIGALLVTQMIFQHYEYFRIQLGDPAFNKNHTTNKIALLENVEKNEVVDWLKENEEDFSRVQWYVPYDEVVANFENHNNNMIYEMPGIASYHSLLSKNLGRFIYESYQIKQFDSFSHFYNVDERIYLQTYLQANHMVVEQNEAFEPKGYTLVKTVGNYRIYKLNSILPFAYVETNTVNAKDFLKLSIGQREELLLTAYVSKQQETNFDVKENLTTKILLDNVSSIPEIADEIDQEGILAVSSEKTYTLPLSTFPKETDQLLVSISIEEVDGKAFNLSIQDTLLNKRSMDNTYSLPITDFSLHIDEEVKTDQLVLTLTEGRYKIKDIVIEAISLNTLHSNVLSTLDNAYVLTQMEKNHVGLTGNSAQAGMLVTSIPYSPGWKVKVNNRHVKAEEINEAFVGIPLAAGEHSITMTYHSPFLRVGIIISLLTGVSAILLTRIGRRRRG